MRNPGGLFSIGLSVLGMSGSLPAAAQDIYKWVDDGGVVNYADVVPLNVTAQLLDQRIFYSSQRENGSHRPRVDYAVDKQHADFDPNTLSPTAAGPAGSIQAVNTQNRSSYYP